MFRRGHHARGRGSAFGTLLLMQLAMRIMQMPIKPPVTLALVVGQVVLFYAPFAVTDVCMLPGRMMLGGKDGLALTEEFLPRLALSVVTHADELHLAWNMGSLLSKGVLLESAMGSARFALTTAGLAALTQGIYLVVALLFRAGPAVLDVWQVCCVGFSGVLFAYKVLCDARDPAGGWRVVFGVRVPVAMAAWAELVVASLLNPRASFIGHLCGILAGYVWLWTMEQRGLVASAPVDLGLGDDVNRFLRSAGLDTAMSICPTRPRPVGERPGPSVGRRVASSRYEADDEALARALQAEEDSRWQG